MAGQSFNTDVLLEQISQQDNPLKQLLSNIVAEVGCQFDQLQALIPASPTTKPNDTLAILAAVQHIFDSFLKNDAHIPDEFDGNSARVKPYSCRHAPTSH